MIKVFEIFQVISKIPHCSFDTTKLQNYIIDFSKDYTDHIQTDEAGNILITIGEPRVCLQSHYDMVCIGTNGIVEVWEDDFLIKANESTLGADNGIGVAIMLDLISRQIDGEYLFTNDEEVGLIGAKNLSLNIKSSKMLNLDSEEEGGVCIGCAGGFDLMLSFELTYKKAPTDLFYYEIFTDKFTGGHSGIEIGKNIPNGIKKLITFIEDFAQELSYIEGGQRHNSIPTGGKVVIGVKNELKDLNNTIFEIQQILPPEYVIVEKEKIFNIIKALFDGVLAWNSQFDIPQKSGNLAIVKIENGQFILHYSGRSMDNKLMDEFIGELNSFAKLLDLKSKVSNIYPSWTPYSSAFSKYISELFGVNGYEYVIHAGLECAVIKAKFEHIDIASIGPNIFYPHTKKEYVEKSSVLRVYSIVKEIMKNG